MKKKQIILVIVAVVALSAIFTSIGYSYFFTPLQTTEYKMYLRVGGHTGFNVGTDAIYFGTVTRGGGSERDINLNNSDQTARIRIQAFGELEPWVSTSNNNFVLKPYENITVTIRASVPPDAEFGNYTGDLKITLRRVLFE